MEVKPGMPIHYSYFTSHSETGEPLLIERKFYPVRETDCCYFVVSQWVWNMHLRGNDISRYKPKRVLKGAIRSSCYPTKEKAFESIVIRKQRLISHSKQNIAIAELFLDFAKGKDSIEIGSRDFLVIPGRKHKTVNEKLFDAQEELKQLRKNAEQAKSMIDKLDVWIDEERSCAEWVDVTEIQKRLSKITAELSAKS